MDDGEQDGLHDGLLNAPRVLVATTVASLLLAGSAFVCRSNLRNLLPSASTARNARDRSKAADRRSLDGSSSSNRRSSKSRVNILDQDGLTVDGSKDAKSSRSKERRRRGKDPLKEIMKGGKRGKALAKLLPLTELSDTNTSQQLAAPSSADLSRALHSRDTSISASSRSESSASSTHFVNTTDSAYEPSKSGEETDEDVTAAGPSFLGEVEEALETVSDRAVRESGSTKQNGVIPASSDLPVSTSAASHSKSDSTSAESTVSLNTPPSSSSDSKTPVYIVSSQSSPIYATKPNHDQPVASTSSTKTELLADPWAWDGSTPLVSHSDMSNPKPPRFRTKSRGSSSSHSPAMQTTTSMPAYLSKSGSGSTFSSPSSQSSVSMEPHEEALTFPPSSNEPGSSRNVGNSNGNSNGNGNTTTPRVVATPRRTPTPSSSNGSTPPPSLSAQTQIASLRGALEAARLREEKMKNDIDKYTKDLEAMRWETATWRTREAELQGQIHHLMHQLQSYAALFASVPPSRTQMNGHLQVSGTNHNGSNPTSPNGYAAPPPPSPNSQSPPLQMLTPNGMLSPGMLSPMQMHSPHAPFFAYQAQQPPLHSNHPSPQTQSLYSLFFPFSPNVNGAGSSASGTSSVESVSPEQAGSPVSPTIFDRGRRRTRTRTQTANARMSGRSGGELGEGWVIPGVEDYADGAAGDEEGIDEEDDNSDDGSVSEVLADAILKDPGSIRVGSKKRGRDTDKNKLAEGPIEFTYPSLSDLGNVYRENRSWASDGENGEPALGGGIPSQFAEEMTDDGNMSVPPNEEDGQADQSANSQDVSQMSQDGSQQQ